MLIGHSLVVITDAADEVYNIQRKKTLQQSTDIYIHIWLTFTDFIGLSTRGKNHQVS